MIDLLRFAVLETSQLVNCCSSKMRNFGVVPKRRRWSIWIKIPDFLNCLIAWTVPPLLRLIRKFWFHSCTFFKGGMINFVKSLKPFNIYFKHEKVHNYCSNVPQSSSTSTCPANAIKQYSSSRLVRALNAHFYFQNQGPNYFNHTTCNLILFSPSTTPRRWTSSPLPLVWLDLRFTETCKKTW